MHAPDEEVAMSTYHPTRRPETRVFSVGDIVCLPMPVGTPGPDGAPVARPAVVASVSDWLCETTYELVPAAVADDLAAHASDIHAAVALDTAAAPTKLRFVPEFGLKVGASAPVFAVVDNARRETSREAHLAQRRARAEARRAGRARR